MMPWYSQDGLDAIKKFQQKLDRGILFGDSTKTKERLARRLDNKKWAYVFVGKTRKMVWVDNKTMKAYKRDGYEKTDIEIKHFTFERWCTSFDL